MARKKKQKNPTPLGWALIFTVPAAVIGAGWGIFRLVKTRRSLPPSGREGAPVIEPPRPGPPPAPPLPPPAPSQCGPEYPGFIFDGTGCVPTEATPAGVYIAEQCTDFVLVRGDVGVQPDAFEMAIAAAIASSSDPAAVSADPTSIATDLMTHFWPECTWPAGPQSSVRIQQFFQALSYMIGREVAIGGGRVLGTSDFDMVDEAVAERLAELGLADFDPEIVPEIEMPQWPQGSVPTFSIDYTTTPPFSLQEVSSIETYDKPGMGGTYTIIIERYFDAQMTAGLGQTIWSYKWWVWAPGVELYKYNASATGSFDTPNAGEGMAGALAQAKAAINAM